MQAQRLDKWLWCARLVKTRTGAARLVEAGKIRVNGARALKPSRLVQAGDVVTATPPGKLVVVRVLGAEERRGAACLARTLYEDLTPQDPLAPNRGLDEGRQKGSPSNQARPQAHRRIAWQHLNADMPRMPCHPSPCARGPIVIGKRFRGRLWRPQGARMRAGTGPENVWKR